MSGGAIAATSCGEISGSYSKTGDAALLLATRSSPVSRENLDRRAELSIGGILYLTSVGLVAAVLIVFLFGAGFSSLLPRAGGAISVSGTRQSLRVAASSDDRRSTVADQGKSTQGVGRGEGLLPSQVAAARGEALVDLSPDRQAAPPPPPKQVPAAAAAAPPEPIAATATVPPNPGVSALEVGELLEHGDSLLFTGDVVSARLFYERAAAAGDGRAALRLGATFDPNFLSRAGLGKIQADAAQARLWYSRALDLGAGDAKRQLDNLTSRPRP